MGAVDDLASANVNRSYSLAAASLSIFTFMLVFLSPRVASGQVDTLLFQAALAVMGLATFSFVFASFHYYGSSLGTRIADAERGRLARRGDRLWLVGYVLLFLAPSLILFAVGLLLVGVIWLGLWLALVVVVVRQFPRVQTPHPG
jgi:hypothetical protein